MGTNNIRTDDTLRETVQHGNQGYPFAYYYEDIWDFDLHCIDWHWHQELEFVAVKKGTSICFVGNDRIELRKGEALLITGRILHRFESRSSAVIPNIVFSPELIAQEKSLIYEKYISPVLTAMPAYMVFEPGIKWNKSILEKLDKIFSLQGTDDEAELRTVSLLMDIWIELYEHIDRDAEESVTKVFDYRQARLKIMMQFIHDHYDQAITLDDIASAASVSKSGALHLFKEEIRISPVAYLIQYRLRQAAGLLKATEKTVLDIAAETGFASSVYFCRKFKEIYKTSPNEYRKTGGKLWL